MHARIWRTRSRKSWLNKSRSGSTKARDVGPRRGLESLAASLYDLRESAGIQAGAADQCSIDIRLLHQLGRVRRLDAPAVLNPHFACGGRITDLGEDFANEG